MYQQVLTFWFEEIDPKQWWVKSQAFDQLINTRFGELLQSAASCELYPWRANAQGRLAEIIVLDQFSRNIFRDSPLSFANDKLALALAQEAIALKADQALSPLQRSFMYLPFMHSESKVIHQVAFDLYKTNSEHPEMQSNFDFELRHKAIIDRFGRYPHRNNILGRQSTAQESEFLTQPGSGF